LCTPLTRTGWLPQFKGAVPARSIPPKRGHSARAELSDPVKTCCGNQPFYSRSRTSEQLTSSTAGGTVIRTYRGRGDQPCRGYEHRSSVGRQTCCGLWLLVQALILGAARSRPGCRTLRRARHTDVCLIARHGVRHFRPEPSIGPSWSIRRPCPSQRTGRSSRCARCPP
jgi:hypothetical protein